jgi:hypothetical protein
VEFPGTVTTSVFDECKFANFGGESTLGIFCNLPGYDSGGQRGPVEAEVGTDAGIRCYTQIIPEQKDVDRLVGTHDQMVIEW